MTWNKEQRRIKDLNIIYNNVRKKAANRKSPWEAEQIASRVIRNILRKEK